MTKKEVLNTPLFFENWCFDVKKCIMSKKNTKLPSVNDRKHL